MSGIPFMSFVMTLSFTLMMSYDANIRDWSLLYAVAALTSVVESYEVRRGGLSRNTYLLGVKRGSLQTRRSYSSLFPVCNLHMCLSTFDRRASMRDYIVLCFCFGDR